MRKFTLVYGLVVAGLLGGCTVHPAGEREEREAAARADRPFEKPMEVRPVPPLAEKATPEQLVEYALRTNADLEQHYWQWRSAIEQIPQDGTQATPLNVAVGTSITNGRASWGGSTVTLDNDPMSDIKLPGKLDAAAKQALENARAAGRRFLKAKYDLRNRVLGAYYDYALNAELIRLEQGNQQLLRTTAKVTETRNGVGSSGQQDVLNASNDVDMSGNDVSNMQAQLPSQRAAINALLSRAVDAPLDVPTQLPSARALTYEDAELIDLAAKLNPELAALADEIRGRGEGIRIAKLQYVPDFNLSVGTDLKGMTQSLLGQATIPAVRREAIQAAVAQAQANLRTAEAMRRQAGNDLAALVIADISAIRDADRQLELFERVVVPRTREIVNIGRSTYETGRMSLLELLNDERSFIVIERLVANLRVAREKHLVELESITASDLSAPRRLEQ